LRSIENPRMEGLRLGLVFSIANFVLDLCVLVLLLKAGPSYFASLTVRAGYLLLFYVPWAVGRALDRAARMI